MYQVIGTCSLCGGRVSVRALGLCTPTATCESCGAMAAQHGPIVPMVPVRPQPAYIPPWPMYYGPGWPPPPPWQVTCSGSSTAEPVISNGPAEWPTPEATLEAMLGLAALKGAVGGA